MGSLRDAASPKRCPKTWGVHWGVSRCIVGPPQMAAENSSRTATPRDGVLVVVATLLGGGPEPRNRSGWADRRASRTSAWLRCVGGAVALGIAVNCGQVAA